MDKKNYAKKYRTDNKEKLSDYLRTYRNDNKEYMKSYYMDNLEKFKNKIDCVICHKQYSYANKHKHMNTKHHIICQNINNANLGVLL